MDNIKYGLAGVITDTTSISKVMPEINSLIYRGYKVQDLAEKCSFLEVVYLLLYSELPNKEQLDVWQDLEKKHRTISPELQNLLEQIPNRAHPMDVVRSAISYLGLEKENPTSDIEKTIALIAKIPIIIAFFNRKRKGLKIIPPSLTLNFTENFFMMYFGKIPQKEVLDAFNISLILYAEHSFNASTFTARVITSTTSDIYSAMIGAVGALKGALHGGANEAVMYSFLEIAEPENAKKWILDALMQKKKIMGFGHRVYRKGDSRVPSMKKAMLNIAQIHQDTRWVRMYEILEKVMLEEKSIHPNLDFPAGPTYYMMGFEIDIFTPIFVMSRLSGWSAHILEQQANNKLIRPSSVYTGPGFRDVPSIKERT